MSPDEMPAKGPVLPFEVPKDLYPFEHRFFSVSGIRIHYVDEGHGETILFLHGNPTWSFVYRDVIRGLRSNRYRCVAPDYPGFGMSGKPKDFGYTAADHARIMEAWITSQKLKDLTLFVHDWGGPIGLWLAVRHPDWIKRIIIANTWAWPVQGDPHFTRFSRIMGGTLGRILIGYLNVFVNSGLKKGVVRGKERLTPPVMQAYRAPFAKMADRKPMSIFPAQILAAEDFLKQVETGLAKLQKKPILILWGEKDIAFRMSELERFKTIFPAARVRSFPNAGHFVQEDVPEDVVSAIRGWM
ncbi:MAG: alpha/beta fold hydrolase [Nitrospirae bacterium]|nr:alpha/beta fold hydrolase [Nitrospirota bacterium]